MRGSKQLKRVISWTQQKHISLNTLRTGDADLRFYITTVQDGWRKSAFLTRACFPCTIHLIMQYKEPVSEWSCWRMFIETWPHSECTDDVAGRWPATSWVHYTTSCNTQSSAPEDGQNNFPKHVEPTGIINKPLLLYLVGCLYYLY